MSVDGPADDLAGGEADAVRLHADTAPEAEAIWVRGLNILLRAMDAYHGHKIGAEYEHVVVALFTKAWNSHHCARDLALRGYPLQALNLLRQPVEDWAAYWYLRNFPERYEEFTDPAKKTPRFNDMLLTIEGKHGHLPDRRVRGWVKRLHAFSHVDRVSVRMVLDKADDGLHYKVGPTGDALAFRFCTAEAVASIAALLEALDNFLRLLGVGSVTALTAYHEEVVAWQEELTRRYPELTGPGDADKELADGETR